MYLLKYKIHYRLLCVEYLFLGFIKKLQLYINIKNFFYFLKFSFNHIYLCLLYLYCYYRTKQCSKFSELKYWILIKYKILTKSYQQKITLFGKASELMGTIILHDLILWQSKKVFKTEFYFYQLAVDVFWLLC